MRQLLRGRLTSPAVRDRRSGRRRGRRGRNAQRHGRLSQSAGRRRGLQPDRQQAFFGKTVEPYTGKVEPVFRYTLTNCTWHDRSGS